MTTLEELKLWTDQALMMPNGAVQVPAEKMRELLACVADGDHTQCEKALEDAEDVTETVREALEDLEVTVTDLRIAVVRLIAIQKVGTRGDANWPERMSAIESYANELLGEISVSEQRVINEEMNEPADEAPEAAPIATNAAKRVRANVPKRGAKSPGGSRKKAGAGRSARSRSAPVKRPRNR